MDTPYRSATRRTFLRTALLTAAAIPVSAGAEQPPSLAARGTNRASSWLPIVRDPDAITAYSGLSSRMPLSRDAGRWAYRDMSIRLAPEPGTRTPSLSIRLSSPETQLSHVHLRWNLPVQSDLRCLGDAWERSYGDLEWRCLVPNRALPWYFLTFDGTTVHGYGVRTQPAAFCFWQLDSEGVSLWADVRNGGNPVALGPRELAVAIIMACEGHPDEEPLETAQRLCRSLCAQPRLPAAPIFGSNDWNYAYGHNTAEGILRDADLLARVAPPGPHQPLVVIDDGWQDRARFPDMARLAEQIHIRHLRPGLWVRPLRAPADAPAELLLPPARFGKAPASPAWDPTLPEAREHILEAVRTPVSWGYQFIKHDFSTWELLGRWGFEMGASPAADGWNFADHSLTTAEVVLQLYKALRGAAGEQTTVLGCNTVGHLAAGIFESQRIGDDTSGTIWERTRRMGVNCLAFRMPQHRTFSHIDPDIVAFTTAIDWKFTRQWLDVVARSGVSLFVAPQPAAMGAEQVAALRSAFQLVQSSRGYAQRWLDDTTPPSWEFSGGPRDYDWLGGAGAFPFTV